MYYNSIIQVLKINYRLFPWILVTAPGYPYKILCGAGLQPMWTVYFKVILPLMNIYLAKTRRSWFLEVLGTMNWLKSYKSKMMMLLKSICKNGDTEHSVNQHSVQLVCLKSLLFVCFFMMSLHRKTVGILYWSFNWKINLNWCGKGNLQEMKVMLMIACLPHKGLVGGAKGRKGKRETNLTWCAQRYFQKMMSSTAKLTGFKPVFAAVHMHIHRQRGCDIILHNSLRWRI